MTNPSDLSSWQQYLTLSKLGNQGDCKKHFNLWSQFEVTITMNCQDQQYCDHLIPTFCVVLEPQIQIWNFLQGSLVHAHDLTFYFFKQNIAGFHGCCDTLHWTGGQSRDTSICSTLHPQTFIHEQSLRTWGPLSSSIFLRWEMLLCEL